MHTKVIQKNIFEFYWNAQLCVIFMNMYKTESLHDCRAVSPEKNPFWQQNTTPDTKLFITQSKHIFWSNEKLLKAYDLFLFLWKNWTFGHDPFWSCFCQNSVLKKQFQKVLLTFSQNCSIIKYKVKNKIKSKYKVIKL